MSEEEDKSIAQQILDHLNDKGFLDEGEYEKGKDAIYQETAYLEIHKIFEGIQSYYENFIQLSTYVEDGSRHFDFYVNDTKFITVAFFSLWSGAWYIAFQFYIDDEWINPYKFHFAKFFLHLAFKCLSPEFKHVTSIIIRVTRENIRDEGGEDVDAALAVFANEDIALHQLGITAKTDEENTIEYMENELNNHFTAEIYEHIFKTLKDEMTKRRGTVQFRTMDVTDIKTFKKSLQSLTNLNITF